MDRTGWIVMAVAVIGIIIARTSLYTLWTGNPPTPSRRLEVSLVAHNAAMIKWEKPTSDGGAKITGFIVEMNDGPNEPYYRIVEVNGETDRYQINDLKEAHNYGVRVKAKNVYGSSEPIVSWLATTKKVTAPKPPRRLEVSLVTHAAAMIKWEEPTSDGGSPITGFIVEMSDGQNEPYYRIVEVNSETDRYQINDLKESHNYGVRVKAKNVYGSSEPIVSWLATTKKVTAPKPPRRLEVSLVTHDAAMIKWEEPISDGGAEITGFIVEMSDGQNEPYYRIVSVNGETDRYQINDLKEAHNYGVRVKAKNVHGSSEPIVSWLATTKNETCPTLPRKLQVAHVTHNEAIIKWQAPEFDGGSPITGFVVQMSGGRKTQYRTIAEVDSNIDTFHMNGLLESRGYCIRVRAKNIHGESEPIVSMVFTLQEKDGTADVTTYLKYAAAGGVLTMVAAPFAVPAALAVAGFTTSGIAAGSVAAKLMALYGGTVGPGSLLAMAQSIGAAGLGFLGTAVTGTVGAAIGGSVAGSSGSGSKADQEALHFCD